MNPCRITGMAAVLLSLAVFSNTALAQKGVMRDVATHEQLVQELRKADQADPMKTMPVSKYEDPAVLNPQKDLISQSDFLSFQGLMTLVPKRAILQIPENYKERVTVLPGAKILGWAQFYAANRGWITTVEVSRAQAEGKTDLPEDTHKQITKCGNLVVATYMGGPISVLPLKEPEKDTEKTASKQP